ncbi:cation:proton antiporter [Streptomyces sp. 5-8]|uniref:Cation:proton antiporter n=1 Tax=Streptomyces musisoli TaxID=2802280 RepID=A0ABS1NSX4_9ACTN|nr:cation:proton antiporter [Streptomyces musisoli]MBL1103035.1 cation:proton antiporter [Streptomyces musisoli]
MNMDVVTADVVGAIALVLGVSSLLGALARRLGQPTVVGQIAAGIILGPSLLGRLPGDPTDHLFPHEAVPFISVIAQIAVVIFMFGVGYEIDLRSVRSHRRAVSLIATGAILIPLALGSGIAMAVQHLGTFDGRHTDGRPFVLFFGVATSITALPVLAAIVRERGIAGTLVGNISTAAAGLMDVAAWLLLAAALIGTDVPGSRPWLETVLLLAGFIALMTLVIRPVLKRWFERPGTVLSSEAPVAFVLAAAGAWATASLGLHPIFGAFVAGFVMPKPEGAPDADVLRSMEQAGGMLLPLFFVVTGLTINLGALSGSDVALLGVILVCGTGGKAAAGYAMARLGGLGTRQSAMIGALVNTRGLTELIALNVGLSAGIIDDRLFTVLVLMALITTAMTGPLLTAIDRRYKPVPVPSKPCPASVPGARDPS